MLLTNKRDQNAVDVEGCDGSAHRDLCELQGTEGRTQSLSVRTRKQPTRREVLPRLLPTKEAAAYLGVSGWTLRQWYRRGFIASVIRINRTRWLWDTEDLNAAVERIKNG